MAIRIFSIVILLFGIQASGLVRAATGCRTDTVAMRAIVNRYACMLGGLHRKVKVADDDTTAFHLNPYYYRLFVRPALYRSPLRQTFGVNWEPALPGRQQDTLPLLNDKDSVKAGLEEQNRLLMRMYINSPALIQTTEQNLKEAGELKNEVMPEVPHEVVLAEKERDIDLAPDLGDLQIKVRRPNFWSWQGDYSLQFTQSYFSDNWYQGGENNYTMLALVTMNAKYDNKDKVQWENKLEMRLGFQTSKSDEIHKFKTNDDLLRFTTKIGYKAAKRWYYTLQVQAYTQFYPSYKANSEEVSSDFMSPYNMSVSLGMDYKLELKRFRGSAVLTPVSYNFRYVGRKALYTNFGLKENRNTYNYFGPSITVNYQWDIYKNIRWDARAYWFSNLEMTTIEWENTFTFTLTKYLTTKLFVYPRIDDSSPNYRSEDKGSYFMFKEWFSLGLNYSF